jgi:hypothetical protein
MVTKRQGQSKGRVAWRRGVELWLWRRIIKIANSFRMIVAIYVTSLVVGGLVFARVEETSISDGLWWAVVTALTIGYGDLSPSTDLGRAAAAVFQHFWVYGMVPLIAVNLLMHVMRDRNQFSHEEQEWQEEVLRRLAARFGVTLPPAPSDTTYIQ